MWYICKTMKKALSNQNLFKGHPVLSSQELEKRLGSRMAIKALVDAGQIVKTGSGYYASPSIDPSESQFLVVARFFPRAVISGISALQLHKITDEFPERVSVDIERNYSLRNKILEVHRVSKRLMAGVTEQKLNGITIRVYSPERSLCDVYRRLGNGEVFLKALQRYKKNFKPDSEKIAKFDKLLNTQVLAHLRQELTRVA